MLQITITTTDERLVFKSNVIPMNDKTLIDFRLSRGCGLEFKRNFVSIKNAMSSTIEGIGCIVSTYKTDLK